MPFCEGCGRPLDNSHFGRECPACGRFVSPPPGATFVETPIVETPIISEAAPSFSFAAVDKKESHIPFQVSNLEIGKILARELDKTNKYVEIKGTPISFIDFSQIVVEKIERIYVPYYLFTVRQGTLTRCVFRSANDKYKDFVEFLYALDDNANDSTLGSLRDFNEADAPTQTVRLECENQADNVFLGVVQRLFNGVAPQTENSCEIAYMPLNFVTYSYDGRRYKLVADGKMNKIRFRLDDPESIRNFAAFKQANSLKEGDVIRNAGEKYLKFPVTLHDPKRCAKIDRVRRKLHSRWWTRLLKTLADVVICAALGFVVAQYAYYDLERYLNDVLPNVCDITRLHILLAFSITLFLCFSLRKLFKRRQFLSKRKKLKKGDPAKYISGLAKFKGL